MTKNRFFGLMALLIGTTLGLWSEAALGQATMKFLATKDAGLKGYGTEQMSSGGVTRMRPFKTNQNATILDFDTAAMEAFLQANPGTATWTLNILPADGVVGDESVGIQTLESLDDWAEGDGWASSGDNFNWTSGTADATYFYASTVHNNGVLDVANSLKWIDPDSGPYTITNRTPNLTDYGVPGTLAEWDKNPTPAFTNTQKFLGADLADAAWNGEYTSVVLDPQIVDAMIQDENNRGLRMGSMFLAGGIVDNVGGSNFRIWDKDDGANDPDDPSTWVGPYLEVTIEPGLAGDFDSDGDVDGNDFLVWQRNPAVGELGVWQAHFGDTSAVATVASVPEPSSLLLLAVGTLLWAGRRKRECSA